MTIPDEIAETFTTAFDCQLADEIADSLSCQEVEALADLLEALGHSDLGDIWIEAHATQDDEGDQHHHT